MLDAATQRYGLATTAGNVSHTGVGVLTLGFVWVGDPDEGRRLLPSMADLGAARTAKVVEQSSVELQTRDDDVRRYTAGHYLPELTDAAIDAFLAAARRSAARLAPHAAGVSVNSLGDEGAAGVRRAYPPVKLARLTALKDGYDPDNVFHLNQNIRPSAYAPGLTA